MIRSIAIQNPANGQVVDRPADTCTLDVPPEFDRVKGVVSLDAKKHAKHVAADGRNHDYLAMTRPLSWRVYGEECLVADRPGRQPTSFTGTYRLRSIKPPR